MQAPDYQDFDRGIWDEELADYLPDTIYDMHVHMWSERHRGKLEPDPTGLRLEIDYQDHLGLGE